MVAIGIVTAIVVTLVAVLIPWLPDSASVEMDRITFVYWFATVISIGIFALVMAVIIYSMIAFRVQPDDESDGPPIHGHTGLEIVWTAIPAVLVVAIGVLSAVVLSRNAEAGPRPLTVNVYAQQFAWRFVYPDQDGLRSNELVLPVDRGIEFVMTSADVIHSFWIPEMGQKQDVLPGVETGIVVTPTREGSFALICTELCGLGHATMRAPVRVLSESAFDEWVASQQEEETQGGADGASVFASAGCGGCHTFAAAGSSGEIGPALDDLAVAANDAGVPFDEFVRDSITNPNGVIASGFKPDVMPKTYGDSLTAEELEALVVFLTGEGG
jgi:cytochrome c oxidase subunit 2